MREEIGRERLEAGWREGSRLECCDAHTCVQPPGGSSRGDTLKTSMRRPRWID